VGVPRLKRALGPAVLAWLCACAGEGAPGIPLGELSSRLRPDDADSELPQPRYDPGSTLEFHDSSAGHFRVHFVRAGAHAVPARDTDANGAPDYVEDTADEYERVLSFYLEQGFRAPLDDEAVSDGNGGDARFDVYLLNFPTGADGSYRKELCGEAPGSGCAGYMLQENDFDGRGYANVREATRIIASHELFHAVQNAYLNEISGVLAEASAVWASERYDARTNDFETLVPGYLMRPERSLLQEPSGPPDAFSYGAALWFRQLEEAYDAALVPKLWDELSARAEAELSWPEALEVVLSRDYESSLGEAFTRFARWNLYTAGRADPTLAYASGARYPLVTERSMALPLYDDVVRLLPLSAHHFAAAPATQSVHVAVAAADALDAQHILLARERAGRIAEVREAPASQVATLDGLELGDRVHLVLVDTRAQGDTLRVKLCVGDENALAPCDASEEDAGSDDEPHADSDAASKARTRNAGCSATQRAPESGLWWTLAWLLLLLLGRLGRRAGHSAQTVN
jgi:hypothetical protein